jgi:hypothetical protein
MSSKNRQQTTQTQNQAYNNTSTYGWQTPPDTADIAAQRNFQFSSDPRVPYNFARARANIGATYDSPTGAYTTPAIRDAAMRASYEDLGQQEGQALREEDYARQALEYAKRADVASMTQPRLVQESSSGTSSGTSSGNTVQSQGALPALIQGGSAVGSALIM